MHKATIILDKSYELDGIQKNYIDITFSTFSEIDAILERYHIDVCNIWRLGFNQKVGFTEKS